MQSSNMMSFLLVCNGVMKREKTIWSGPYYTWICFKRSIISAILPGWLTRALVLSVTAGPKKERKLHRRLVGSFKQNSFNELIKFRSAVIASQPFQHGHKNFTCFLQGLFSFCSLRESFSTRRCTLKHTSSETKAS